MCIRDRGTTNGTITSMDGDYTLSNVPKNATLVFSYVGKMCIRDRPCDVFFIYTFIYISYICGNSDLNLYCYVTFISFVWFYPI